MILLRSVLVSHQAYRQPAELFDQSGGAAYDCA